MASTYVMNRNSTMGSRKRKASGPHRGFASALSRNLFFNKGPKGAPMTVQAFDKFVARSLAKRNIASPEQKCIVGSLTGQAISVGSAITLISPIIQGDTQGTRSGSKVRITKIELQLQLFLSSTAGGGQDAGKISLFIQKQCNGVLPIFETAPGSAVSAPYNSNGTNSYPVIKNTFFENEFYIIRDWDYCLDATAGVAGAWETDTLHIKAEIPISRIIEYNAGNAGTVADCVKNAVYLGYVGGQVAGATNTVFNAITRIWFTDM